MREILGAKTNNLDPYQQSYLGLHILSDVEVPNFRTFP